MSFSRRARATQVQFPYSIASSTTMLPSSSALHRPLSIRTKLELPPPLEGGEPHLLGLPPKLLRIITSYLPASALHALIRVCRELNSRKLLYLHSSEKAERGKEELRIHHAIYDIFFTLHGYSTGASYSREMLPSFNCVKLSCTIPELLRDTPVTYPEVEQLSISLAPICTYTLEVQARQQHVTFDDIVRSLQENHQDLKSKLNLMNSFNYKRKFSGAIFFFSGIKWDRGTSFTIKRAWRLAYDQRTNAPRCVTLRPMRQWWMEMSAGDA